MSDLSETPFRVYYLDHRGHPHHVASADEFSLGGLLVELRRTERVDAKPVGVMYRPVDDEPGEWIVNPWNHGPPSYQAFTKMPAVIEDTTGW